MTLCLKALLALLALTIQPAFAQLLVGGPNPLELWASHGKYDYVSGYFTIEGSQGMNLKFKYDGVTSANGNPVLSNYFVVSPTSGTTPALVKIFLNPAVAAASLSPGVISTRRVTFSTVDETPPGTAVGRVSIRVSPDWSPEIKTVVNTASFQPWLSPGAMVSILGSSLASPEQLANFDDTAQYPTSIRTASVTFNGVPAPLLCVSETRIDAVVPYSLAGQSSAEVIVTSFYRSSPAFTVSLDETSPAIYTASRTGRGQAAVALPPDIIDPPPRQPRDFSSYYGSAYLSAGDPLPAGATFELFCTGAGVWKPPVSGDISLGSLRNPSLAEFNSQPLSLTVGGLPARIILAGTPVFQVWGLLWIRAVVPEGVGSGPQSVVLTIGPNDSSQQSVTLAIQ